MASSKSNPKVELNKLAENDEYKEITESIIADSKSNILVFAVCYSLGTDKDEFLKSFRKVLSKYSYKPTVINISEDIIKEKFAENDGDIEKTVANLKEFHDIDIDNNEIAKKMAYGTAIRLHHGSHYFAYKAILKIFDIENDEAVDKLNTNVAEKLKDRKAYIVTSIKNSSELELLSTVFGKNFFLLSLHQNIREKRENFPFGNFEKLQAIDNNETISGGIGQSVSGTFHKAHYFISVSDHIRIINAHCERFLKVVLGHKLSPPTEDEYGNYLAFSAALKSMDVSRQVGASILKNGDVLSTGANDVQDWGKPYWYGIDSSQIKEFRDYSIGIEPNRAISKEWANRAIDKFKEEGISLTVDNSSTSTDADKEDKVSEIIQTFLKKELTEFGRIIHAEMDAIISSARRGICISDATIYVTTLPCHNCAKHIAAAGIKKVVYVEPYDKSRLLDLNPDSITTERDDAIKCGKVLLEPFVGFGIQKFRDYFSVDGRGFKGKIKRMEALSNPDGDISTVRMVVSGKLPPEIDRYEEKWVQEISTVEPRYYSFTFEIIERLKVVLQACKSHGKSDQ